MTEIKCLYFSAFLLFVLILTQGVVVQAEVWKEKIVETSPSAALPRHLRHQLTNGDTIHIDETSLNISGLKEFYRKREYRPIWTSDTGARPEVDDLLGVLRKAKKQGLNPLSYHLPEIIARQTAVSAYRLSELELLLSDAFLAYAHDVHDGQTNPSDSDPDWHVSDASLDHLAQLEQALTNGPLLPFLKSLPPQVPMYEGLQQALRFYQDIASRGGWPTLNVTESLKPGMRHPAVHLLRERLRITGDFFSTIDEGELYDLYLEIAVRNFQSRHGLDVDGLVGPHTLEALNIPVEEKINKILMNLERWRWMPQEMPLRYLLVNMAGFELRAIENNRMAMNMRVIVGKTLRSTPTFSDRMTHLILNPYWNVPTKIAIEDILPIALKDPSYLTKQTIKVFNGWSEEAEEIDPAQVPWTHLGENYFPYHLRQEPGPHNALGRIKFMFPNRFAIYMHDTPHQNLFNRTVRTFSSGCIRLEKPMELASYVMRDDPFWDDYSLQEAVKSEETMVIGLPKAIPVYLVYWTAWAEHDGSVHFRNDIYGRDKPLNKALEKVRTATAPSLEKSTL